MPIIPEFRTMTSHEDLKVAYVVLKELRHDLDYDKFIALYERAKSADQYTLIGCFVANECVAVMGYRVLYDFVHGPHLYIDDLVTTKLQRSRGIGKLLLAYAVEQTRMQNLQGLRLCTGIENESGKRFYHREGWQLRSVAFKKSLK